MGGSSRPAPELESDLLKDLLLQRFSRGSGILGEDWPAQYFYQTVLLRAQDAERAGEGGQGIGQSRAQDPDGILGHQARAD